MSRADGDLTVLLPLKDRARYTLRWLSYAESIRLPFKVLIADGGVDAAVSNALSDRRSFPNVDFEYIRYRPDDSHADYYAKLADAAGRIKTPYVAMIDNDDFLVVDALRESVQFLREHSGHVACGGQSALFWVGSDRPDGNSLYGKRVEWKAHRGDQSNDGDTARARLRNLYLGDSETCFYLVKRTHLLQAQFQELRDLGIQDLFLMEILLYFRTAIAGCIERLDCLQIARQQNSPGSSASSYEASSGDTFGRMLLPGWSAEFAKFVSASSNALAERDQITLGEARDLVVEAYRAYGAIPLYDALLKEPSLTARTTMVYPMVRGFMRRLAKLPSGNMLRVALRRLFRAARWIPYEAAQGGRVFVGQVPEAPQAFAPIARFLESGSEAVHSGLRSTGNDQAGASDHSSR